MKLFDKAFDKAVKFSQPVKELTEALKDCAVGLKNIGVTVAIIAHNQAVHHQMIMKMWHTQQAIFSKLTENALDTRMPDIDGKAAKDNKSKPN